MKSVLTLVVLCFSISNFACDNCNVYLNVTPKDNTHSVGIYYRQRQMMGQYSLLGQQTMTKHASHGNDPAFWGNQVTELYRTFELRGAFMWLNRWRTYIVMPYTLNSQSINDQERFTIGGFSDPTVLQSYQLNDPTIQNENFRYRLEIGLGVKAPIGRTDAQIDGHIPNLDLQAGSGSWDGLGMLNFIGSWKILGLSSNVNFKMNSFNQDRYRYGHTVNVTSSVFAQTKVKNFTFIPLIGTNVEWAFHDESTITHYDTGGHAVFIQGGIQIFFKSFQLFGEFQKALSNKMNGYTQLINKHKINLGLVYNFK